VAGGPHLTRVGETSHRELARAAVSEVDVEGLGVRIKVVFAWGQKLLGFGGPGVRNQLILETTRFNVGKDIHKQPGISSGLVFSHIKTTIFLVGPGFAKNNAVFLTGSKTFKIRQFME
jgi:hypothetical protein